MVTIKYSQNLKLSAMCLRKVESYDDEIFVESVEENKKLRRELRKKKKLSIKQKRELKYSKYAY